MKRIAVLIYILSLAACKQSPERKEQEAPDARVENSITLTPAQLKNANIATTLLQQKSMPVMLQVNGKIDVPPQNMVSVSVALGGYLKSTRLLPGVHVSKGESIAVMEDQQYVQLQQDYLLAKSKLHFAELEYKRQKELNESQASSDKVTQQAEAEMNAQRIAMFALAEKLRLIHIDPAKLTATSISRSVQIFSSINGFVSRVNVNPGKYVSPSEVLFELIDPDDIHLNLRIFEKDVAQLNIGQKVMAYTNAHPEKKYLCEIILISKDINSDGTADVHCHFSAYDKTLLPGTYMNAQVEIVTNAATVLPEESIVRYEGKQFVFIENKTGSYTMTEVNTGNRSQGFVEIVQSGQLAIKPIVTRGAYTLLMKAKNKGEEE